MTVQASLAELRERYLGTERRLPVGLLETLEADARPGARSLAKALRGQQKKNRAEGQRLRHMLRYEQALYAEGLTLIAGVDEAGMAPLYGPVVAGAVILPKGYKLKGLDDSKKILDEAKRDELAQEIKREAIAWATGEASTDEIDTINIYHAGLLAMRRAVEALGTRPEYCLVDARKIPGIGHAQKGIIKGDALSLSIAAASVIAKTTRDAMLREHDERHPGYGFASHKGYPTPEHLAAIDALGVLPLHRRSFAPIKIALGLMPVQTDLFAPATAKTR